MCGSHEKSRRSSGREQEFVLGSLDEQKALVPFRFPAASAGDVGERRSSPAVSLQRCQAACCTIHASRLTAEPLSAHTVSIYRPLAHNHPTLMSEGTSVCLQESDMQQKPNWCFSDPVWIEGRRVSHTPVCLFSFLSSSAHSFLPSLVRKQNKQTGNESEDDM